jgi:hypothetical protein
MGDYSSMRVALQGPTRANSVRPQMLPLVRGLINGGPNTACHLLSVTGVAYPAGADLPANGSLALAASPEVSLFR